jgi:KDO2-lipid IV(A) lauroyltransferase
VDSYLIYILAYIAINLFRVIPRPAAIRILDHLAGLTYRLDARHRHIADVNLNIAFPELSDRRRSGIAKRSFQMTARNLLEVGRMPQLTRENIASLVRYHPRLGLNNYELARSRQRGILYLTGHFSSWELLPTAHALNGYPLSFVTRPLDNAPLERYLLRVREASGNRVIPKKRSARGILETLKSKGSVGILMDQNTSLQEGIYADFFGLPAATSTSVALFALRTDAVVLPGYLTPLVDGRYTIKFLAPMDPGRTGDMSRDIETNTAAYNRIVEGIIREHPESWLWGHKRWKNQPPDNPDLYSLSKQDLKEFLAKARK